MTTATTTNKQLYLITPGTEVGAWGPYINSTTSILDKALGSTLTVAMAAANVTLSSADAEYQRILITGTLSANLNLTFPAGVGGAWIVTNSTSNSGGPWTITATTGSGTTAILTQGYSTFIYSDGTNIGLANPAVIQNNTITNAMLVQAAALTVKGNITGSTANVTDIPIALASDFASDTTNHVMLSNTPWDAAVFQTLTYSGTVTPNFAAGFNFSLTLAGSATLANPSSAKPGQSGVIYVSQDGSGGRTLSFGNAYKFAGGAAPTISSGANQVTILSYFVVSSSYIVVTTLLAVA
jgi:hypothetical protein